MMPVKGDSCPSRQGIKQFAGKMSGFGRNATTGETKNHGGRLKVCPREENYSEIKAN